MYPIDFTQPSKRFVLSLYYNGSNSLYLLMLQKYQFKRKDSETKGYTLCLSYILKRFTINNMKKARSKGIVNFFSVDFNPIDTDDILDIHRYLMKGK